jgi:hypothetical protein
MSIRQLRSFLPALMLAVGVGFAAVGCVDHTFDEPPVADLPGLSGNATIADIKALYTGSGDVQITEDWIIDGVVAADDQSGNFYQQIIVQDSTGGLAVRMATTGLFNKFPAGSQVFIRAKGLYISDYNGFPQLNGSPGEALAELLIPQYVIAGQPDKGITPVQVTLAELNNPARFQQLLSTLVEIKDVQFADASAGVPYADAVNRLSVNRTAEDCIGNSIIVRTSGYADFAASVTPEGKGNLIAVLSLFRTDKQLLVRNTADVNLAGPRCGTGGQGGELVSIASVRSLFTGATTTAPAGKKIKGVVISDRGAGNIDGRNMVVQDGDAGIVVRFTATHNYNLGDEVEVNIDGIELSAFRGLLQLNSVPNGNASRLGAVSLPTPREATVGQLLTNGQNWESTLVKITNVGLSGGSTYANTVTLNDGTGSVPMYTRPAASFATSALPAAAASVTAIVSDYDGVQLNIRKLSDVETGGGGGGNATLTTLAELRTAFQSGSTAAPASRKIRGVVISDRTNVNITDRNIVLQDASGGIVVRFAANHNFALGEELEINVGNLELSTFFGLLQINNVPLANAASFGPGTMPAPRVATVAQVVANLDNWESTLIRISDVTIAGGGTYSGSKTISDGSGEMVLFTRSQATFSGTTVPAGPVTITGVVTRYDNPGATPQLTMRNLSDIQQ